MSTVPRRKRMQRTAGLRPGGPLARTGRLGRTAPLERGGPLPQRSEKTERVYREGRRPLVARLLAARPWCEIRWDEGCAGQATDVHEPGMRSRGADITDPGQCVTACRHCHDRVHASPEAATLLGWLIPSGRPGKAVPRRAEAAGA